MKSQAALLTADSEVMRERESERKRKRGGEGRKDEGGKERDHCHIGYMS